MKKLFIWGAGERGKIIADAVGINNIMGFIDNNLELQGKYVLNRRVYCFEDYKKSFHDYFVIVTPKEEDEIVKELRNKNIMSYFRMSYVPSEMQGYGEKNFWKYINLPDNKEEINVIYGTNLYAYMLWSYFKENGYERTYLCECGCSVEECDIKKQMMKILECTFIPHNKITEQSVIYNATRLSSGKFISNSLWEKRIDLFDLSEIISEYYNPDVMRFKNIHIGKRCFIIATGPSLKINDLKVLSLNSEITFGLNRIFNVDEKIWKPTYYLLMDRLGMKQYWNEMAEYSAEVKFIGDSFVGEKRIKGDVFAIHTVTEDSYDCLPAFSENVERKIYVHGTVTYAAIQLAVYMGFSEIYLLGVDCDYQKNSKSNYFFDSVKTDNAVHNVNRMFDAYKAARKYADEHHVTIMNATRGGKLEEFERISFDDLF